MSSPPTVSWRFISREDEQQLVSLYDVAFGVPSGKHFTDDFPTWNPALQVSDRTQLGGFIGSRLVSSVSLKWATLASGQVLGIIGGVVVHPDFRGQGLASEGISQILSMTPSSNLKNPPSAHILWGSEKLLYGKFGFKDAGIQKRAPLELFPWSIGTLRSSQISQGWSDRLGRELLNLPGGVRRQEADVALYRSSKNIQWFSVSEGSRMAFLGIGKGIDLQGMIHTWGGDPELLEGLLGILSREVSGHLELLWHPSHEERYPFLSSCRSAVSETLMMMRSRDDSLPVESLWFWGIESA